MYVCMYLGLLERSVLNLFFNLVKHPLVLSRHGNGLIKVHRVASQGFSSFPYLSPVPSCSNHL